MVALVTLIALLVCIDSHWFALGCIGCIASNWFALVCIGLHWFELAYICLFWFVFVALVCIIGCIALHWFALLCIGLYFCICVCRRLRGASTVCPTPWGIRQRTHAFIGTSFGIQALFGSKKSNAEQFKNKSAGNVAIKPKMPEIYPRFKPIFA